MGSFSELRALRHLVKHAVGTRPGFWYELSTYANAKSCVDLAAPYGYEAIIHSTDGLFRLAHRKSGSPNPHLLLKVGRWDDPAEQVWQRIELATNDDPVFLRVYRQGQTRKDREHCIVGLLDDARDSGRLKDWAMDFGGPELAYFLQFNNGENKSLMLDEAWSVLH